MLEDRAPAQKVRICVDGRLAHTAATGVASYAAAMREALAAVGRAPLLLDDHRAGRFGGSVPLHESLIRLIRARSGRAVPLRQQVDRLHAPDVFRLAHARFAATGRLLDLVAPGPGGVMHWTYPIPARIAGWVNLYTVHDAIPLTAPALSPTDPVSLRRRILAVAAGGDRILTVSAAARRALLAALPLAPSQICDCGTAAAGLEGGDGALPAGLAPGGYYLFCGLAEPRKNLPRLIDAWAASGSARPLVLAGPDFRAIVPRPGVIVLSYQPRFALIDLMRQARALLFPSLAEGFGLPVIEAMALGTPVLTADRDALAEAAGGGALLVDPADGAAIAGGIARLDRDDALCAALSARGRRRAAAFTPAVFGRRLAALHAEFADDPRLSG